MNETSSINGWTLGSERPSRHAVALTRDAGITAETRLALRLCLLLFFLLTINLVSNSNICKFVFHCPCFGNPNPDHCFLQCCVTIQFAGVWLRDISNGMLCGRETWANGLRAAVPTRNGYPLLCSGQGYATALALIVSRFVAMIFVDFFQLIEPPPKPIIFCFDFEFAQPTGLVIAHSALWNPIDRGCLQLWCLSAVSHTGCKQVHPSWPRCTLRVLHVVWWIISGR